MCPALGQALVMIYCRHLCEPEVRREMRALVAGEYEVLKQFDALDELHAEYPFGELSRFTLREELSLLYWHNRQLGETEMLEQLRMLSKKDERLLKLFDRMDATET
jgi:hypothetical protein